MCAICVAKSYISPSGFIKPMKLFERNVILCSRYWSVILGKGGSKSSEGPPTSEGLTSSNVQWMDDAIL